MTGTENQISFKRGNMDHLTGAQWVYVPRHVAHGHRLGRLGLVLWLIVIIYLVQFGAGVALLFDYPVLGIAPQSIGIGLNLAQLLLTLLVLIGLILRMPLTIGLIAAHFVLSLSFSITGLAVGLGAGLPNFLILFYMLDSDRANLTYRYRYRSWPDDRPKINPTVAEDNANAR